MNHVFRLTKGQDLKKEIENYVKEKKIEAGIIKCGVGCIYEVTIRLADGKSIFNKKDHYEIVSLIGTVSQNGCHIHISLAGEDGNVIGGHLKEGCLINTTAEICIEELKEYTFIRAFDETTEYKELVVSDKKHKV